MKPSPSMLDAFDGARREVDDERTAALFMERTSIVLRIASFIFIGWVGTHHMPWFDAIAITLTLILTLRAIGARGEAR